MDEAGGNNLSSTLKNGNRDTGSGPGAQPDPAYKKVNSRAKRRSVETRNCVFRGRAADQRMILARSLTSRIRLPPPPPIQTRLDNNGRERETTQGRHGQ